MHEVTRLEYLAGRVLRLSFADGTVTEKDFSPLIERGGVFARLIDESYWRQARIGPRGRTLEWPPVDGDSITALDICADALWFEAHPDEYETYLRKMEQMTTPVTG